MPGNQVDPGGTLFFSELGEMLDAGNDTGRARFQFGFRHAFQAKPEGGEIHVEVQPRGRLVECRIQDNGMGATTVKAGYGLKIIEALARRLDGAINHQFSAQGCVATLTFPLTPAA